MQNINLHKIQFPPSEKVKFSKKASVFIVIACITLISLTSLAYWKIDTLNTEYKNLTKNSSVAQSAIDKLQSEINASADDDKLKITLLNIKDKLKHKQALKEKLDEESLDISSSFYQRFAALSRQDIKGVWLTGIAFSDKGKNLTLAGITQNPELLTIYLKNLSNEAIFSGLNFDLLSLEKDLTDGGKFSKFAISSKFQKDATALQKALGDIHK